MSALGSRCNSLKPTKLPDGTQAAPTPLLRAETANVGTRLSVYRQRFRNHAKSCRGAVSWLDAMLLRKMDFGKGRGKGYSLLAIGYWLFAKPR